MDLYCAFCLEVRKDAPERAVTIINGIAACFDHTYHIRDGAFHKALVQIKLDEKIHSRE